MENLIQTTEFIHALFNTAGQAIESFVDGVQISDAPDFIDEALSWKGAIDGLKEGFPSEARTASDSDIELLFEYPRERLLQAGLNPLLVGSIVSSAKGMYYTYAAVVQNPNQNLVEDKTPTTVIA